VYAAPVSADTAAGRAARSSGAADLRTAAALCLAPGTRRGAVVVRPAALRRLDRIDTVVADAEVLLSPEPSIGEVIVLPGADAEEAAERVHALFDPAEFRHGALGSGPGAATVPGGRAVLRGENGWTLGPVELPGPSFTTATTRRAHRAAPALGADRDEVLRELGYGPADVERLAAAGAFGSR